MRNPWFVGCIAISLMALIIHNPPRLKHMHILIVKLRAAAMTAKEMWIAAWERAHNIYPEMERRAKLDV